MQAQTTTTKESLNIPIVRIQMVQEENIEYSSKKVDSPSAAVPILSKLFKGLDREAFVVLGLNADKKPVGVNVVAIGTLTSTDVAPREVFKPAILCNSASIVIAHNHPSGNLEPSEADINFTKRLLEAGNVMAIPINDHLIFGNKPGQWTSMRITNPGIEFSN